MNDSVDIDGSFTGFVGKFREVRKAEEGSGAEDVFRVAEVDGFESSWGC